MKNDEVIVDNIDVFCEKGVFGLDETRRILKAGKAAGLALNFHGDELHPMKAAEVYLNSTLSQVRTLYCKVWIEFLNPRLL